MAGCVKRTTETASMTDGLGKALAWFMVSEKYKENQFFLRDEFVYECNEYEFSKALFYAVVTLVIYGSHG